MSNDKTLGDAVRYEWLSASEQWKACDHSEAKKLSAAGYEVREVRSFRMDCTCPSGDGSLRHPCPAHPATLATAKHGGCVQLGGGLPPIREDEPLRGDEPASEQHDARMFNRGWNACREAAAALSAQPSPGGQGNARVPFEVWAEAHGFDVTKDRGIYNTLETRSAWEAWLHWQNLAARQPVGETAPWRCNSAAVDSKALATATEIALMWGKDRSQFVSRIQAAVIDAMQWMNGGLLEKPAQAEDLGQVRAALQAAEALCVCCASVDGYSRSELNAFGQNMRSQFTDALALIDGKAEVSRG